jgi:hypothetical protein
MRSQNLRVIAVTSFLTGLFSSMTQAVWQPFVLSLGAPMSTLGSLESLGGEGTSGLPLAYHRVAQGSDALDLHLHHIAGLQGAYAGRRAGENHVAGLQGHDL